VIFLGVVAVVALVGVVWVLPSVLTQHPRLHDPAEQHKAITDTRTGLVATLAAIGAAGGLAYTARTYRLSREGQLTDRYSKAVAQLGDEKIEIRLGGIYALERLMRDSPADQPTNMETLAAFVRQHSPPSSRPVLPARGTPPPASDHPSEDVQAVLTVLGRRGPVDDERPIDLARTNLTGARLDRANLTDADLRGATLTDADPRRATRTDAILHDGGTLTGAHLYKATLTGADLGGATLTGATLFEANLTGANLHKANLTDATLLKANLTGAHLFEANLTGAHLHEANLTDGSLTDEQLASAEGTDEITWIPPSQQTG
jgi:pentapeptide repeat protein